MRIAVALVLSGVVAFVAWRALRGREETPDRAARPAPATAPTNPEIEFPREPAAFLAWWRKADATAKRQATAVLKRPGPVTDALIAALIGELFECKDTFRMLGDRALPVLEAVCLQPDGAKLEDYDLSTRRHSAFCLTMMLASGEEKLRFLVACLQRDRHLQYAAAEAVWTSEANTVPRTDVALRRALAQALAALPAPVQTYGFYSGPPSLRSVLSEALLATLDRNGRGLGQLLADADPAARLIGARIARDWVESDPDWPEEKEKSEREAEARERGREAVRLLLPLLADPVIDVRNAALRTFAKLGKNGIDVPREPLMDCLANPNEDGLIRGLAALALTGPDGNASAELLPYLADPDATVRAMVVRGLGHEVDADHPDPAMEPRFLAALADDDGAVRAAAAAALEAFATTPDASCRQALAAGLDDPEEEVRLACAAALNQYDARPVEAIPHLEQWLAYGSEKERKAAIRLASSLGAEAAPLEASLAPLALRGDPEAREDVLRALGNCAQLDSTLDIVLRVLEGEDRQLRLKAVEVLVAGFGDRPRVHDALEQTLSDADSGVRMAAAGALSKRGLAAPTVVRACLDVIESKETWLGDRRTAVEVLARYGRDAAPAVPSLLRMFDDPPSLMRRDVVETFSLLPALADLTVPALVTRAADGDEYAVAALLKMGPAAEPYLGRSLSTLPSDQRKKLEAMFLRIRALMEKQRQEGQHR